MNLLRSKIVNDLLQVIDEAPVQKIIEKLPASVRLFVKKDTVDLALAAAKDAVASDAFAKKVDSYIDAVKVELQSFLNSQPTQNEQESVGLPHLE